MLEFYDEEDVVLLSVNSDAKLNSIVEAKSRGAAPRYRTWWGGYGVDEEEATEIGALVGPIATEWTFTIWPMTYVINEQSVVRYARKLGGHLIAAVDELVLEEWRREYQREHAAEVHQ